MRSARSVLPDLFLPDLQLFHCEGSQRISPLISSLILPFLVDLMLWNSMETGPRPLEILRDFLLRSGARLRSLELGGMYIDNFEHIAQLIPAVEELSVKPGSLRIFFDA